ncbi:fimbria/pilus outer membrane usher protein [Aeromonas hydrophila]|uniref:fimbria/pilus outer membrane usher protein n=1 Tax=Aeromonas hydrophila TaxID=644 RepID=UPI001C5B6C1D|nr:fimbria/pilus outer membrane usher protein [Aeromonas hydrophila]MBW3832597.1 fimbria/pilus outer membrane usher protein [Aeromonas hydrophila]MBW5264538.1 fimbria/pilus outer membrane usher protein [Aeromonas hydrophila]MBW5278330.1 fimbria/pilus outer membrane usher protein [Aeromonas hydrophila]
MSVSTSDSVRKKHYSKMAFMLCVPGLMAVANHAWAETEFNIDALDLDERTKIDLSQFADEGYILPGDYYLEIEVNKNKLPLQKIPFYETDTGKGKGGVACLPQEVIPKLALTDEAIAKIDTWHDGQCANLLALDGVVIANDIGNGLLRIAVPQAWMKYSDPNWIPPEQWDEGIPGMMLDYNINAQVNEGDGYSNRNISSYGTLGFNYGAWRLRGDYQANAYWGDNERTTSELNRIYAYRPLPNMAAKLTVGEQQLNSQLIDGFRYTGVNLANDERMLPPSLQGYAPEVSGIAKTNAKVTISQSGRILYETNVPAGPFRIQGLDSSVRGRLDVRVEEQDGSVNSFQVDTATVPYLTRPGYVRYNLAVGAPSEQTDSVHDVHGPAFVTGDFSWGVANSWSLYGGSLVAGEYNSMGLGIGRDLYAFGAISADLTQSIAKLPGLSTKIGQSVRVNYAKQFDEYNSSITFAGYRFSQHNFMTMSQFLSNKERLEKNETTSSDDYNTWGDKELYTITANKTFWAEDAAKALTVYLDYTHRTYWEHDAEDRYGLTINKNVNIGSFKDVSVYVSAYKTKTENYEDDKSVMLTLSMPIGDRKSAGYSVQSSNGKITHLATYQDYSRPDDTYQLGAGVQSNGHAVARGYYNHNSDIGAVSLNAYSVQSEYTSVGASLRGGLTATQHGAALHQATRRGGTRMMVDTDKTSGVSFNNGRAVTNRFGVAVISDMTDYRKSDTRVDVDQLSDDIDAMNAIKQGTLTEGAIGYNAFEMAEGFKLLANVKLPDGSVPPFGATVVKDSGRVLSVVDEDGLVYLTGVKPNEAFELSWGGARQCKIVAPQQVTDLSMKTLTCK